MHAHPIENLINYIRVQTYPSTPYSSRQGIYAIIHPSNFQPHYLPRYIYIYISAPLSLHSQTPTRT
ncbi:hypothetical protein B0T26DRAFT_722133 [Lasiosphaeria miniovina]|uniref:Uncharacterized protein n=1 Tax=Lasiosphaeria miniovina TaxID=1954250 RepID=A0AA40DRS1_9PEZI|nr:uncharacterized protein B0T26DRAFT_722133 [Lasiosphaeria miniovina]KAK0709593.1 hypothetical protein B0T26DRAFT_722133 [Lasiosphaeria miniovina]